MVDEEEQKKSQPARRGWATKRVSWTALGPLLMMLAVGWYVVSSRYPAAPAGAKAAARVVWLKVNGSLPHVSWTRLWDGLHLHFARHLGPHQEASDPGATSEALAAGRELFHSQCSDCHGQDGMGGDRPLAQGPFRHGESRESLFTVIANGITGAMPASSLKDDEIWALVTFVESLRQNGLVDATVPQTLAPVPYERLLNAADEPESWLTYSGTYLSQRYSRLASVNRANVLNLKLAWVLQTDSERSLQTSPIVANGNMYLTVPPSNAIALDLDTGKAIWRYFHRSEPIFKSPHPVNRGVALLGDRVYLGTVDARLVALDAASGKVIWDVEVGDSSTGYYITAAPLAVKDKIIVGVGGGEEGVRGFLDAYDAVTGERAWRFYTVPGPGERGHETWAEGSWLTGAATTWLTGSFDPELNLLYWGVGNPGPVFEGEIRKGDNLYSECVIALDVDSGELRWWYQFTPHDVYDWDSNQIPVLVDAEFQGVPRKLMLWANRNAFFYVLDRQTGEFLLARPFVKQNWVKEIDSSGRPVVAAEAVPSPEGTVVYPGSWGGTNWFSPSYSPATELFYIPARDNYAGLYFSGAGLLGPGISFTGRPPDAVPGAPGEGKILGLDPQTGKPRWSHRLAAISYGGILSTAGGLVFASDDAGHFFALDAEKGERLWQVRLDKSIRNAPVTYLHAGKQQIAIAAGSTVFGFDLPD